ncbi:Uncharacterised protein [Vibrio cholerae]|nr:Uncharacterised protein [Vibrio cholerae]CSI32966.1 Uncharacterised protein [Vibrio cholerae]
MTHFDLRGIQLNPHQSVSLEVGFLIHIFYAQNPVISDKRARLRYSFFHLIYLMP